MKPLMLPRQAYYECFTKRRRPHAHWTVIHPSLSTRTSPLSSSSSDDDRTNSATNAFDRDLKRHQRDNAARAHQKWRNYALSAPTDEQRRQRKHQVVSYDYIREEIAMRLVDRLDDIRTDEGFPLALDMGAGAGYVHRAICAEAALQEGGGGIGGVRKLVQLDSSKLMLHRDADRPIKGGDLCDSYRLEADEEDKLPFPSGTFDLVISSASLHWVNKLPNVLAEIKRVLRPDGCFMWAMIGGTTLPELRVALLMAELEREGGVSPHIGPFVGISDVGGLLQRAGFTLPTIDVDTFKVSFPNAATLMEHLQRMGENNAGLNRKKKRTSVDTFLAAACIYDDLYGVEIESSNSAQDASCTSSEVGATVNVIYSIGWVPHESQQKPLERGTATHRIQDHISKS